MMARNGFALQTSSTISCCHHCVPPKRHTACWGHCPEYLNEKAAYEAMKEARRKKESIERGLNAQKHAFVNRTRNGGK